MFRSEDEIRKKNLTDILTFYHAVAQSDWHEFRYKLPAQECWRFFIDGDRQEPGNRIAAYFFPGTIPDCTIKEFAMTEVEDPLDWGISNFMGFIRANKLRLSREECETLTLRDLIQLDGAWLSFEKNESNYLKNLITAAQEIFAETTVLNTDLILKLHKLAMTDVKNVAYARIKRSIPGAWRTNRAVEFDFEKDDITVDGVLEIFDKYSRNQADSTRFLFLNMYDEKHRGGIYHLDEAGIAALAGYHAALQKEKSQPGLEIPDKFSELEKNFFYAKGAGPIKLSDLVKHDHAMRFTLHYLAQANNKKELAENIVTIVKKFNREKFLVSLASEQLNPQSVLQNDMEKYLKEFSDAIAAANTPFHKLFAIVTYIQSCHQEHPFLDGNGRVFTMLLLNFLLIKYGFIPAILDNPGCFNGYSSNELVLKVIEGMENTVKLIKENKVFNVATQDVLKFLDGNKLLQPQADYFREIIQLEMEGRKLSKRYSH